jgi:DNA-binding Xre family transcriptional regulator
VAQTKLIVETLKRELRKYGINYRQVAEHLNLSEGSVKRLFADRSFTLERISKICEMMNCEISDLIHEMERNLELTQQLTIEQETELVSDIKLLLMAYFLLNKLSFEDIITIYDISETEGIRLLAKLDRMNFLELQPGNRVKLKVAKDFKLIPGGPIQKFYESTVEREFFSSSFDGNGESRIYISGFFSRADNAEIIRKMNKLAHDANQLIQESEDLPLEDRYGCTLLMAIRPWEVGVFDSLRRVPNVKKF